MSFVTLALTAFLTINALTFAQFGIDKHRALHGGWRIRESSLLGLAFVGGTPAAYAARRIFRHKTRNSHSPIISRWSRWCKVE
ncbi:MAG: DUF1294 domain-containing protein [Pseudomonadota bacterium]